VAVIACGTPLVCFYAASLPEVVSDAAILVDPSDVAQIADAMRLVLTQPALAAALRARNLARSAQFTWERTARETMAVNGAGSVGDRPERYSSGQASTPRPGWNCWGDVRTIGQLARDGYNAAVSNQQQMMSSLWLSNKPVPV
jgi:hypothetical protein